MKKLLSPVLLLLLPLLLSCSEPARIPGFDSDAWQQDKKGCNGTRNELVKKFDSIRRELYGKSEDDIKAILGRPDAEQLMSRGQRVFLYYLEPGSQCDHTNKLSNANRAEVRF
ncbi:hypothetical protein OB13_18755, partial [Pontibacter sp. HJ8]